MTGTGAAPDGPLRPEAAELLDAFVGAFPSYLAARLAERELTDRVDLDAVTDEGLGWLRAELDRLLRTPFREQRRSPLEVFQEAMRFPNEALDAAGVVAAERDDVAQTALPGDRHDLAPASSRDLGEAAWLAHLAWGAAKARVVTGPAVAILATNLLDRTRLTGEIESTGRTVRSWLSASEAVEELQDLEPEVVLVDVEATDAEVAIRVAAAAGVRTVVFGPHLDREALARAAEAGATRVVPRARLFRDPGSLLDGD